MSDQTDRKKSIKIYERLKKKAEGILKDPEAAMKVVDEAARKANKEGKKIDAVRADFANLTQMLRAYLKGDYKILPWTTIVSSIAAMLYFLNPLDVIPDFILGFGMIDDATVIAFCLRAIKLDLEKFVAQKKISENQQANP